MSRLPVIGQYKTMAHIVLNTDMFTSPTLPCAYAVCHKMPDIGSLTVSYVAFVAAEHVRSHCAKHLQNLL